MTEPNQGQDTSNANDTASGDSTNQSDRRYSDTDVDKFKGDARKEARQALLNKLGVETEEEAEQLVSEYRTIQDATKDDFTRLEEERNNLKSEKETVASERDSFKERSDKYEAALKQELEARMEGIPDHIKTLLEGRDPVDQLSWLTENQEALGSQVSPLPTTPDGSTVKPKGAAKSYMDRKYGEKAS